MIRVIYMLMENKSLSLKPTKKRKKIQKKINFSTQFCLGNISNGFSNTESREVSLNGNVYDFSVHYNSINKSTILNIHKYLMIQYDKSNLLNIHKYLMTQYNIK